MRPDTRSYALRGRIGGFMLVAKYGAGEVAARARSGFNAKFLREADPDGTLPEAEREQKALALRKAYFAKLAYQSSKARSKRAKAGAHTTNATASVSPKTKASRAG